MNVTNLIDIGTKGLNNVEPKNDSVEKSGNQGKSDSGFESVLAGNSNRLSGNDKVKEIVDVDKTLEVEDEKIIMNDLTKANGMVEEKLPLKDLLTNNMKVNIVNHIEGNMPIEDGLVDLKKSIPILDLRETKLAEQNPEDLLQDNALSIEMDDSLFKQEVLKTLKEVANKSLEQKDNEKIKKDDVLSLVNQIHEVIGLLAEMQKLLGNEENIQKGIEDIKNRLNLISSAQLPNITNGDAEFSLKDFNVQVNDIKNKIADLFKESNADNVLKTKFNEVLTRLNTMEDAIVKIKQNDSLSDTEVEVIQLIKKDTLKDDIPDINNENSEIDMSASENNMEQTEVSKEGTSDIIPKTDMNTNVDRTIKSGKPIELNLEQLKEKVNDKINLIEKMTVSKDKILISLNPRNMGDVELFFKKTAEGVELTVEFNEKHTKHKLEAMFDDMKKDLKEKNIDLNFIFKEKEKNNEENSERKKEYIPEERMLENENEPEQTFQEVMKRVLRGE